MDNTETFSRILAIDFGTKRIGLALCDPLKTFAYPLKTVLNDNKFFDVLRKIIREQEVSKIILGYPLKENGEPASLSNEVLKFKKIIEEKFNLEVILYDERYSSSIALEHIMQSVTKKSKRKDKGLIDQTAAAVILQSYLDGK